MALLCFDLLSSCFFFAYGLFFWLCDYAACVTILALTSLLIFFFYRGCDFQPQPEWGNKHFSLSDHFFEHFFIFLCTLSTDFITGIGI